jgi:hypothetical protein
MELNENIEIELRAGCPALEHIPKKLLDFFDKGMLQLSEFERFLPDHME